MAKAGARSGRGGSKHASSSRLRTRDGGAGNRAVAHLLSESHGPAELTMEHAAPAGNAAVQFAVQRQVVEEAVDTTAPMPMLRLGSSGPAVTQLQTMLNGRASAGLATDSRFGPATDGAVRTFQRATQLVADGIVGPRTWQALESSKPAVADTPAGEMLELRGHATMLKEAEAAWRAGMEAYHADNYPVAIAYLRRVYSFREMTQRVRYSAAFMLARNMELSGDVEGALAHHQEALLYPQADENRGYILDAMRRLRTGGAPVPRGADAPTLTEEEQAAADATCQQHLDAGMDAAASHDVGGALRHFLAAYAVAGVSPHLHADATFRAGSTLQEAGRFDEAISFYLEVLSAPEVSDASRARVLENMRQARLGQRGDERGESEDLTGDEQRAIHEAGAAALWAGRYAEALENFRRLANLRDVEPKRMMAALVNAGLAHQRLRQFDQAITSYETALQYSAASEHHENLTERIRQCRRQEVGLGVSVAGATAAEPGHAGTLFETDVWFATGESDPTPDSVAALEALSRLLREHSTANAGTTYEVVVSSRASRRWAGAASPEQALRLNRELAMARGDRVQAVLELPDGAAIERRDLGADASPAGAADDNSWQDRAVHVVVRYRPPG